MGLRGTKRRTPEAFKRLEGKCIIEVIAPYRYWYEGLESDTVVLRLADGQTVSLVADDAPSGGTISIAWGDEPL